MFGQLIETVKAKGAQLKQIQKFYGLLKRVQKTNGIWVKNSWNMDKSGIAIGSCTNSVRLKNVLKKKTCVQSPENHKWVFIIKSILVLGRSIWPLVIFKEKHIQLSWFHHNKGLDWIYTTSKNGWMANCIAFNWLTKVFLPKTKPLGNKI